MEVLGYKFITISKGCFLDDICNGQWYQWEKSKLYKCEHWFSLDLAEYTIDVKTIITNHKEFLTIKETVYDRS